MASIRKHGTKWQARITRKDSRAIAKSFTSKADAEAWARKIESEIERGVWRDTHEADILSFKDALDRYNKERAPLLRSPETERLRGNTLKRYTSFTSLTLSRIRGAHLAELRDALLRDGLSPSTVIKCLGLVSRVFNTACRDWGFEGLTNPTLLIRKPSERNARDRRLMPGELDRIISSTHALELPAFLMLAVETAMRRSELTELIWKNVSLKKRTALLETTKNGEPREVPLSGKAVEILESLSKVRHLDGKVFSWLAGNLNQTYNRALRRARAAYVKECAMAGIVPDENYLVDLRIHDLRHEAVSRLFEKGLNTIEVSTISGHKTLAMLQRYTHLKAEHLAKKLA
jgi:integrase